MLSGFELYPRWVPLLIIAITNSCSALFALCVSCQSHKSYFNTLCIIALLVRQGMLPRINGRR